MVLGGLHSRALHVWKRILRGISRLLAVMPGFNATGTRTANELV
jgi:hypothetical protein